MASADDTAVLAFLREYRAPLLDGQIAAGVGLRRQRVKQALERLREGGSVQKVSVRVVLATCDGWLPA
jgi:hypothetical protein